MFLEAEEKTKAHVRGSPFHVLSSSEAPKNESRSDIQLHRQLMPYPTEVTIFHTLGVKHHTSTTCYWTDFQLHKWTHSMSTKYAHFTDWLERLESCSGSLTTSSCLSKILCSVHGQVFSLHLVLSHIIYNCLWLAGYNTQTVNTVLISQQSFVYPADCPVFWITQTELAKTCFSWTPLPDNFTVTSLLTLQFSLTTVSHPQVRNNR